MEAGKEGLCEDKIEKLLGNRRKTWARKAKRSGKKFQKITSEFRYFGCFPRFTIALLLGPDEAFQRKTQLMEKMVQSENQVGGDWHNW